MNDASIRRHLSGVRVQILDMFDEHPNATRDRIILAWSTRHPAVFRTGVQRAPRIVDQLLWQLLNLEWITRVDDYFVLTPLGRHARELARTAPSNAR